ncbi:MAG: hypothetical protein RR420_00705 [Anaerovoracaceae bacterium]
MDIRNTDNNYANNMAFYSRFGQGGQCSLDLCRIEDVNVNNLTADIFMPSSSTSFYDIPMLMPFLSDRSGAIFMPKKKTPALVISTSSGKKFVLTSLSTFNTPDVNTNILDGENKIFSEKGAIIKQDSEGDSIHINSVGVADILSKNNKISMAQSSCSKNFSTKKIEGVTSIQTTTGKKTVSYTRVNSEVKEDKIIKQSEIMTMSRGIIDVDDTKRTNIITGLKHRFYKIDNMNNIIDSARNRILDNPYAPEQTINSIIEATKIELRTNYIASEKVAIIKEEGMALKKQLFSVADLKKITLSDIETDVSGNQILYRVRVYNGDTEVAKLQVSDNGNVKIECNKFEVIQKGVTPGV